MTQTNEAYIENEEVKEEKSLESVLGVFNNENIKHNDTDKETKVIINEKEVADSIDPWTHKGKFPFWWVLLVIIFGPILLPLRSLCLFIICSVSYITAKIGLLGLGTNDQPLIGWRKLFQQFVFFNVRLIGGCLGVWVVKKGKLASAKDAPLIVVAPHSTFIDWLVLGHTKSSPVAKSDLSNMIFFGAIGRLIQTVWVDREAEISKKETANIIHKRSSESGWPQTLIFPEGTTTNGQALVQFRTGAFSSMKPIQPVVLSFPNNVDTLTWTWIQRFKAHHLLLLTLITPLTIINLEFLPTLSPTKEEEEEPRVFAERVQHIMCENLKIPAVNVSFKDAIIAKKNIKNNTKEPESNNLTNSKYSSTSSIDFVGNLTLGV